MARVSFMISMASVLLNIRLIPPCGSRQRPYRNRRYQFKNRAEREDKELTISIANASRLAA